MNSLQPLADTFKRINGDTDSITALSADRFTLEGGDGIVTTADETDPNAKKITVDEAHTDTVLTTLTFKTEVRNGQTFKIPVIA